MKTSQGRMKLDLEAMLLTDKEVAATVDAVSESHEHQDTELCLISDVVLTQKMCCKAQRDKVLWELALDILYTDAMYQQISELPENDVYREGVVNGVQLVGNWIQTALEEAGIEPFARKGERPST